MVRQHWKPALLLMVSAPILAEVVSGATPATLFFMPWIFFPYATLLYGFPVLVIREVAVRGKLGVLGLWCLGLLYALYNEGLKAATLFYPLDAPLDTFSTYGLVADVRAPFTIWISFWHGLFSVVIPVLFVGYLFPKKADEPWLPVKATWSLAILSVGTAVAYFLFVGEASTTQDATMLIVHFTFLVVAALVLWFVAGRLPRTPRIVAHGGANGFGWTPFFSGVGLYLVLTVVPEVMARDSIPPLLFALYFAVLAVVAGWAIARRRETTRAQVVVFLLGSGTAQAALAVVFGVLIGNIMWSISGAIFTAIFLGALVRIKRKSMAVLDGREA
jgi:hypothetical protein